MLQYCKFKLLLYKELHDYLVALMLHSVAINATIKTQCTGQGTEKYGKAEAKVLWQPDGLCPAIGQGATTYF